MPNWDEYKAVAKSRGALAFELYVAQSTPVAAPEVLKETLPDHLAYIGKLEAEGALAFAGPLSDETGELMEGMGMIVLRADSFETARALIANDPMHATGARTFTLRKWMVNEGAVTVSVKLSGQVAELG